MNYIKRSIHGSRNPEKQLYRRIIERQQIFDYADAKCVIDDLGRYKKWERCQQNSVIINRVLFTNKSPNNAVIIDGRPSIILNINDSIVSYRTFLNNDDFYNDNIPSSHFSVFKCYNLSDLLHQKPMTCLRCKCISISTSLYTVFIPIIHTFIAYIYLLNF